MDAFLSLALGIVAGLIVGLVLGLLIARGRRSSDSVDTEAISRLAAAEAQVSELRTQVESATERNSELLAQQERDAKVVAAITPLQETLRSLQAKVNEMENAAKDQSGRIVTELQETRTMGEYLRATTSSLAGALRNNKARGTWGEVQLQNLVEAAGLIGYVDFVTQKGATNSDDKSIRPDMVVRLPGGKTLVIDSKVPFDAFMDAQEIPETGTDADAAQRRALLEKHAKDVRAHVKDLAGKKYWTGYDFSPEYVIAYIPSESLLSAALEADPKLLEDAIHQGVALASPVSVWAVLRTVAYTWEQQNVTDEARKLYDLGVELYDRMGTMTSYINNLKSSIESTVTNYNKLVGNVESRILPTARKFPGIDETKLGSVNEIEAAPKGLSAPELTDGDN
ncbi:MAG: hypothetical protein RLZZ600_1146 [Actinomycetota bacterium]|jgi:DNA recombination protein RmuC